MVIFASIVHSIFLNVMLTAFADMHGANMDGCDTVSLHGTKLTLHHKSIIKSAECVGQTMWKCVEGAAVFRSGIYCLQAPHDHCECLKHPNMRKLRGQLWDLQADCGCLAGQSTLLPCKHSCKNTLALKTNKRQNKHAFQMFVAITTQDIC
eukprot:1161251-Pelagomonas_calceolata.AAC.3